MNPRIWFLAACVACVFAGACAPSEDAAPLDLGALAAPPPADLAALASYVRSAGGVVLRASTVGALHAETPARAQAWTNLYVQYAMASTHLVVSDGLGASIDAPTVLGATGGVSLVDSAGNPDTRRIVASGAGIPEWRRLHEASDALFFLVPPSVAGATIPWQLYWTAPIGADGSVSAIGTSQGASMPVDVFRLVSPR